MAFMNGWVKLTDGYLLGTYWWDGFDRSAHPETARDHGYGPEQRDSPIYRYDDGGIGSVQWLNVTHDRAAVLKADGGWKVGGEFHLWVSVGARTKPFELTDRAGVRVDAGDPNGWLARKAEAVERAEKLLGIL